MHSIIIRKRGRSGEVILDGRPIGDFVYSASIESREVPEVTLDLFATAGLDVDLDPAKVVIDEKTAEVLVALGWTKPKGDES